MATASTSTSQAIGRRGRHKAPLRTRLYAWWEGTDPDVPGDAAATTLVVDAVVDDPVWSEQRAAVAQLIWGEDATEPGGPARTWDMVRTMGLDSSNTLLDMSAGLGGAARLIAKQSGAWVTGMEPSKTLARQAMARSSAAGMAKRAPVQYYDPETLELPARTFDAVVARDVFFTSKNKEALFATIAESMKGGGQIVFTDYLLREPGLERDEAVSEWIEAEPVRPSLWSVEEVVHYLRTIGLAVRVTEDITQEHRAQIVEGMAALQAKREGLHKLDKSVADVLIAEAEHWARRVAVLDAGSVRVYRIYARKPDLGDGPARTLSDW